MSKPKQKKKKKEDNKELLTNAEIVQRHMDDGLIDKCIFFQFKKLGESFKQQYKEDLRQDLVMILLNYDNQRLNKIESERHFNAFITAIIRHQLYSGTSQFYRTYLRFQNRQIFTIEQYIWHETEKEDKEEEEQE